MTSQNEPAFFQEARKEGNIVVNEPPKFDLESYIANYTGTPKLERLFHIGRTSPYLYHEALALAIATAKAGKNVETYEQIVNLLAQIDPQDPLATPDKAWMTKTAAEVTAETKRLEAELKGYKNNLIKESIRMGYDDAGRHYQEIGSLKDAEKSFTKEREYCQTPAHLAIMIFRLVSLFIDRKIWITVESNVMKLRDLLQSNPDAPSQLGLLSAIMGLAQMSSNNYFQAAESFIGTHVNFLQSKPSTDRTDDPAGVRGVISPNDVATYGALCALASMERTELQSRVLENATFRQFLELEPHLRRAVSFFVGGKFSQCLTILESYRADYLLDVNLSVHFNELFDRVRNKAIVQYFVPFSRVSFKSLGEAFNTDETTIQNSLVDLIQSGVLPGRLDLEKKLLVANTADKRSQVHQDALDSARNFERTIHQRILRMEAIQAGLEVKQTRTKGMMEGTAGTLMGEDSLRGKGMLRQKMQGLMERER